MQPQTPIKKAPLFSRFLWWCAGAESNVLQDFQIEWNKYSGIGCTVLSTALLATISGSYAANMMVGSVWLACAFGIAWGITILSLDRLSVSTISKIAEGSHAAGLRNLSKAIPRFLLGTMFAIVITSPLQVKLFEREINQQIEVERAKPIAELNDSIAKKEAERDALLNALRAANDRVNQTHDEFLNELEGSGSSLRYGAGPLYTERQREYEQAKAEAAKANEALQPQVFQVTADLAVLKGRREGLTQYHQQYSATFFTRATALSALAQRDIRIAWVRYLTILLFVVLETSPILVTLLSSTGPYEQAVASKRERDRQDISPANQESDTTRKIERKIRDAVMDALDKSALKNVK